MFLKSLSLKGFKSFADSTVLEMEPGVTVVVGPNGSGKSNVVDAIAWVLGAQAPSAVRSQKMEDVIFAGTDKRAALGRAEVALTIDNASRTLPIEFEEVTIKRTLFRDGDSEYRLNGVPCRLLDIQELLSDSGVGRQQHVIVSQGQIDAVLNARPEERRLIIEEAAGVLKYRRRREKAERRLKSTEENLGRVQDLLREVRRQLRPLERQAEAARRHGDLVTELRTLQIHLAGREIESLRTQRQAARNAKAELAANERELKTTLAALDDQVITSEARLSATGADDVSDRLARVEGLWERAKGQLALATERISGLERERDAIIDQGVIETLEAEAARLRVDLDEVTAVVEEMAPDTAQVQEAERQIAEQRSLFELEVDAATFDQTAPDAEDDTPTVGAAELRGELAALNETLTRAHSSHNGLQGRQVKLAELAQRQDGQLTEMRAKVEEVTAVVEQLEAQAAASSDTAVKHIDLVEAVKERLNKAQADRQAWTARADALSMAIDEARARSGAERLADVDGVVGTLLEVIDIDEGWEAAFEAAAGDAVAAVVVENVEVARRALDTLRAGDFAGAVLTLAGAAQLDRPSASPLTLRAHVRSSRTDVSDLLDRLIGSVVVAADWPSGVDQALRTPNAVVVTREGDRFAPDGWRVGASGTGATGAALEEAVQNAEEAIGIADGIRTELADAKAAQAEAEQARVGLRRQLSARRDELTTATQSVQRIEGDRRANRVEAESISTQLADINTTLNDAQERQAELVALLPALEAEEQEALDRTRKLEEQRQELERRAAEVGALRSDLEIRMAAAEERRQFLTKRLGEVEARLAGFEEQRAQAGARRRDIEERLRTVAGGRQRLVGHCDELETELARLREIRQRQSEEARAAALELDKLRKSRSEAEKRLAGLRERANRSEIEEAEVNLKLEAVIESLRRDFDCEAGQATTTQCPELEAGVKPAARVRDLERELRIMGPVNPLALDEFSALQERNAFLEEQLNDVRSSRRDLNKVIRAIDDEIVTVFASAFADVAANFELLFQALFPGGKGQLKLTAPDDLLNTGVEVEAKPSGKNVKKLSLLSGGERSLTALGFLFAVFRSRPSPFYVMDEVEAALDDVNLHRFLQLVEQFRDEAQLIIVSHQKRTMEAADSLYGVTMQPGGSSKAVSEKAGADVIDITDSATGNETTPAPTDDPVTV